MTLVDEARSSGDGPMYDVNDGYDMGKMPYGLFCEPMGLGGGDGLSGCRVYNDDRCAWI